MKQPSLERLLNFQKLLLKFSHVERVIHRTQPGIDGYTRENDTEHSYNLAMTAWYLVTYFPELDRDLVIRLALVHDLVEVHAGDTYALADASVLKGKAEREEKAFKQLIHDWPDFSEMTEHISLYENRGSNEAKFVYALDKLMPIMTIYINQGHTWQKENISLEQLIAIKVDKVSISPEIQLYYQNLVTILAEAPHLIPSRPSK